jgi:ribosomal protein S18 acetylase RimI-like enzyme
MNEPITITGHTRMAEADLAGVGVLADTLRAAGVDPRLTIESLTRRDGSRVADWLAHQGGRLVGAASTDSFGDTHEATLLTAPGAPAGVAEKLFAALCDAARTQGARRVLLLHDRAAEPLRRMAEAQGLAHSHAEVMMRRPGELGAPVAVPTELEVRRADEQSLPLVAQVIAHEWGSDPQEVLVRVLANVAEHNTLYYLATLAGEPVVTLNIQTFEGRPWVYGFSVLEPMRGRGLGRQALTAVLSETWAGNPGDIFLEAEPTNLVALNLYQSLGFAVLRTFDYWAKELADDTDS